MGYELGDSASFSINAGVEASAFIDLDSPREVLDTHGQADHQIQVVARTQEVVESLEDQKSQVDCVEQLVLGARAVCDDLELTRLDPCREGDH